MSTSPAFRLATATALLYITAAHMPGVRAQTVDRITPLTVRLYDGNVVERTDWTAAQEEARAILAQAGVRVVWRDCRLTGADAACGEPPSAEELIVRAANSAGHDEAAEQWQLGYSLIDMVTRRGRLATVYHDRVRSLAGQGGVTPGRLLGRVIAHEIGHLMLGSREHSRDGLMRAVWTAGELARNRPADWLFSALSQDAIASAHVRGEWGETGATGERTDGLSGAAHDATLLAPPR